MIEIWRTKDKDLVNEFMRSPDIFDVISEDGMKPEDFEADVERECWLAIGDGSGSVIALYNYHCHNSVTVEIHAHVLPEYRKKYSYATGMAALRWLVERAPQYKKVIAQVPEIHENVIKFIERFAFTREGVNRLSYVKGGVLMDQVCFGITDTEIKELLNEQSDN